MNSVPVSGYQFSPRDATLARYMPAVVFVCLSVCLSVSHKPVLCLNDWTNRAGFWHDGFLPPIPHCVLRKFGCINKLGYFHLELCPKLWT